MLQTAREGGDSTVEAVLNGSRDDGAAAGPQASGAQAQGDGRPRTARARGASPWRARAIAEYFEYASQGVEVIEDGLKEMYFGEYLVERGAIDRYQLLRALQLQDREPNAYLGECLAALGSLSYDEVRRHLEAYGSAPVLDL